MSARIAMLLSNSFRSDPRVEKEAAALLSAGHEVTVIAWDRAGDLPAREDRNGVKVIRTGPRAAHGAGLANVPAYREFYAQAVRAGTELEPDVVHCHDLDTALPGLKLRGSMSREPRLVIDMHELYRDSNMIPQRGAKGLVARTAVRLVERRAFAQADAIIVANPGTLRYYEDLGVAEKATLVENAPDLELFGPVERESAEPFTVGFFGQKRYVQGLAQLIDVVAAHDDMRALLAGGGVAEDEIARLAQGAPGVEVSGRFGYAELPALYGRVDAVHAVYDATLGNVRTLFPVKVMEAMACALPVLVAKDTWIGSYVEEHRIGLAVEVGDRDALEVALVRLAADPGLRSELGGAGRRIVEAGLSWQAARTRLLGVYSAILGA